MPRLMSSLIALSALALLPAHADSIVKLETRPGIAQSFLLLEPPGPVRGAVIMLPGHDGEVEFAMSSDGRYEVSSVGGGLTAHRAMRETLRGSGFAVAVVAPPSDRNRLEVDFRKSAEHFEDMRHVVAHLRQRYGSNPYLQGHCLGTFSVASVASRLKSEGIAGLILSSTRSTGEDGSAMDFERGAVKVPVLLVHHREDSCPQSPYDNVESLKAFYGVSAPKVDVMDGFHGFKGAQKEAARAIASWLRGEEFPALIEAQRR